MMLQRWREDPGGTYRTWFLWPDRIKNFRSIRRGLQTAVARIEAGSLGNTYRGSTLETVVHSIAELRQIFRGANHAWLWKPKLCIPDIYERPENQRAFGHFLDTCMSIRLPGLAPASRRSKRSLDTCVSGCYPSWQRGDRERMSASQHSYDASHFTGWPTFPTHDVVRCRPQRAVTSTQKSCT
jgi:hypothetical protein